MPTPRYENQVQAAPLPGPRASGPPSLDALGGASAAPAASALANQIRDMALAEKEKADTAATQEAYAKATKQRNELIFGQAGLLSRKGHDAIKAQDELNPKFDSAMDDIEKGLGNEAQRAMFSKIRANQREDWDNKILSHVQHETEQFAALSHESALDAAKDDVVLNYRDRGKVDKFKADVGELIGARGALLGWDEKMIADAKEEAISQANRGIILRELENGNVPAAESWYAGLKKGGGLTGKDITWVEGQLKPARDQYNAKIGLQEANKLAQDYLGRYAEEGTALSDFDAKELGHPYAAEAKALIKQGYSHRESMAKTGYVNTVASAIDTVEKGGYPNAETLSKLSDADMKIVNRMVAEGPDCIPADSDLGVLTKYKMMAANDPEKFKAANIPSLKLKINAEDYRVLRGMQLGMIAQKPEAEAQAKSFISVNEFVRSKFKQAGYKESDERLAKGADIFSRAQTQWEAENPGKKMPIEVADKISNEMLEKVADPRWFSKAKPAFLTTIDAVPAADKLRFRMVYQEQGGDPAGEDNYVLDRYIQEQRAKNAK